MGGGGANTSEFKLVGHKNFVRQNPKSDRFGVQRFHHIEFWCFDATNTYKRFQHGLGMQLVAKSDQSTGNSAFASYVLRSHDLVFSFTAPYAKSVEANSTPGSVPLPHYSVDHANDFIVKHGLAVRAVGLVVDDATAAFQAAVAHGARPAAQPMRLQPKESTGAGEQVVSEVSLYGDVVLRFISGDVQGQVYLAGYEPVVGAPAISYGIKRLDHAVGNVPVLTDVAQYIMGFTGFHEFAEFVSEDVGTVDSGLNSVVLANNNEYVLLPVNEPTFGTPRKSQIQTYLEQNQGPGLQHLALKTDDIFATLREMRARSEYGGFEFMPKPSDKYYRELPKKVEGVLSDAQLREAEELGVLVDKDDQGVLLQIFTKPLGDRPTVFIEVIQRVGCMRGSEPPAVSAPEASPAAAAAASDVRQAQGSASTEAEAGEVRPGPAGEEQAAGCGGFGKGNFSELFKRIEDYERTLNIGS